MLGLLGNKLVLAVCKSAGIYNWSGIPGKKTAVFLSVIFRKVKPAPESYAYCPVIAHVNCTVGFSEKSSPKITVILLDCLWGCCWTIISTPKKKKKTNHARIDILKHSFKSSSSSTRAGLKRQKAAGLEAGEAQGARSPQPCPEQQLRRPSRRLPHLRGTERPAPTGTPRR